MPKQQPFGGEAFKTVCAGLVGIHKHIQAGTDESPEAETLRDSLDAPTRLLGKAEREREGLLSEDLWSITEPTSEPTRQMNPQALQQLNLAYDARQNQEWDNALGLLRRWRHYIPFSMLCFLRGRIWQLMCHPTPAAAFFGRASELEPSDATYRQAYLQSLMLYDPEKALLLSNEILSNDSAFHHLNVTHAASIKLRKSGRPFDASICRELIPVLDRTLLRIHHDPERHFYDEETGLVIFMISQCYIITGNIESAVICYEAGLQISGYRDTFLTARGVLNFHTNASAIVDLAEARRLNPYAFWPAFFLAFHKLTIDSFDEARKLCEAALSLEASNEAKSIIQDWLGIAQAALGFPAGIVQAAFDEAVRLDPDNEEAVQNREVYLSFLKGLTTPVTWHFVPDERLRAMGFAEHHYPTAA